jgi:uncharacterized membrane protein YheB (UPF0754 family)
MNQSKTPRTDDATLRAIDIEGGGEFQAVHIQVSKRLERELIAVTEQRDQWKDKYIQQNKDLGHELRDPNGTIWSECKRLQTELDVVTKQRNVAAEALDRITNQAAGILCRQIANKALQSLTTNEQ